MVAAVAAAGCTTLSFYLANAPAFFGSYERFADLPYGDGSRQRLDVYAPPDAAARPVVIFWYGGSWTAGRKADYRFVGAALAERGYVAVIPDYRLHPVVAFPAFVDDGARAVAWVQRRIERYGGDPRRIVLAGHSAGAHTASYLALHQDALRAAGADPSCIRGLVALAGPHALEPDSALLHAIFAAPYEPADWQPVRFVDGTDPPALLVHGAADETVDVRHTEALRDALRGAGVQVEAEIYPGATHVDLVADFAVLAPSRAPVVERAAHFIDRVTTAASPASCSAAPGCR